MAEKSTAIRRAKRWLEEGKWEVTEPEDYPDQVAWLLAAVDENQRGLDVIQYTETPDVVFIQASIALNEEHRKTIGLMHEQDVIDFIWDLRLQLLRMGIDFNNLSPEFEHPVMITQHIAYDGMTKDIFLQRVALVRRALLYYTWSIIRLVESVESHGAYAPVLGA